MTESLKQQKNRSHLFKPGQSGNIKGRAVGSGIVGELRKKIQKAMPDIIDKLISQAIEGDATSAKLLLERVIPAAKAQSPSISINVPAGDMASRIAFLVDAAIDGSISPESVAELAKAAQISKTLSDTATGGSQIIELENALLPQAITHSVTITNEQATESQL